VGGVAFCWRDRLEGSATWFGITDFRGRKKPVYYALQNVWQNKSLPEVPKVFISGPSGYLLTKKAYEYTVIADKKTYRHIEWQLYKDDYLQKIGSIKPTDKPNKVEITLPEDHSNYRIYVYLYDDAGNVTTASKSVVL
jgi:hypothetical protein